MIAVGITIYVKIGLQHVLYVAIDSEHVLGRLCSGFMVPATIFVGCLYSALTGRMIFSRCFAGSRHLTHHTLTGWLVWVALLLAT
jgi:hypothetical protein